MKYSVYNRLKNPSQYHRWTIRDNPHHRDFVNNSWHAFNRAEYYVWRASKLIFDEGVDKVAERKAWMARAFYYLSVSQKLRAREERPTANPRSRGIDAKRYYMQTRADLRR